MVSLAVGSTGSQDAESCAGLSDIITGSSESESSAAGCDGPAASGNGVLASSTTIWRSKLLAKRRHMKSPC